MESRIYKNNTGILSIVIYFTMAFYFSVNILFAATNDGTVIGNSKIKLTQDTDKIKINKIKDVVEKKEITSKEELLFDEVKAPEEKKDDADKKDDIAEKKQDSVKTIRELEENIEDLQVDKKVLSVKFNEFIAKRGELKMFFRNKLTANDFVVIEKAIVMFNSEKNYFEGLLQIEAEKGNETDHLTSGLIDNKKMLYKSLRQFIKSDKLSAYDNYVKTDVSVTQRDSKIDSNIYKKKEILHNKVSTIKKKIIQNETELQKKINQAVTEKVSTKLNIFLNNPQLQKLSKEKQAMIFQKVLDSIITLKEEKMSGTISLKTQKKITLYIVIEDVLRKFISDNYTL